MKKTTHDEFVKKSNKIHENKYDYSLCSFVGVKTKVKILCSKHGLFEQRSQHHLAGHGCRKCSRELIAESSRLTLNDFLKKSKNIHGNTYDYSLVNYKKIDSNNYGVDIVCKIHGKFNQLIKHHLSGSGCPNCKESKGEKEIRKYLTKLNIEFIQQKRFDDCKYKKPLPFDFYLPENNTCIEYQGEQHFKPIHYWGGKKAFELNKKRDLIKENYCNNNNIKLLKINFDENIISKLNKYF